MIELIAVRACESTVAPPDGAVIADCVLTGVLLTPNCIAFSASRSEERRVGKECRIGL